MTLNNNREKHIKLSKKSDAELWANYDAQPTSTRELYQNFPIDVWPSSVLDHGSAFPSTHNRYLAGLRDIWGPDHPAVIDAARKVATRGRKVVQLATADDLDL